MWLMPGDHFYPVTGTRNRQPRGEMTHRITQRLGGSLLQTPTQSSTNRERNRERVPFVLIENRPGVPGSDAKRPDEVHTEHRSFRSDQRRSGPLGVCATAGCVLG